MMKIKFDRTHRVTQGDGKGPVYEAGKTYEFSGIVGEGYGRKYVARGLAHEVSEKQTTIDMARSEQADRNLADAERRAQEAAKLAERGQVEIPDNVDDLPWSELRALASKLTDETIHNKAEALSAITAERGRRAISA